MAAGQRDISVSEFFAKNRHLLGFDNPRKALLTTVKEAVDNSLDACEEAGILPDITIVIEDLQPDRPATAKSSRYRLTIVDNGPGIVKKQVEHIFGRLLYGSKFHRLKMSRGQQGIGISAAGMYGLLTTGKPMVIHTRPSEKEPAHHIELAMNTKTNRAEVTNDRKTQDFPPARLRELTPSTREASFLASEDYRTGTSVSIELMRVFRATGLFSEEPIEVGGVKVKPRDVIAALMFPKWTYEEGEEDLTVMRVIVEGMRSHPLPEGEGRVRGSSHRSSSSKRVSTPKAPSPQPSGGPSGRGGRRVRYTWDLLDFYDPKTKATSMSRTTAFPCTIMARMVASGAFEQFGVIPPEFIGQRKGMLQKVM
ncbi:MAG: saccharopine dehydrogenase C-terminal domain-containing protein, partial [Myxococcota bacterium]